MAREDKPIRWKTLLVLLAVALGLGSLYRFTDLAKRPVHTDEAILAMKTQEFWQTKSFEYDPHDYHGPFLHHLTKWTGSLAGWKPETLTEGKARWVIALCGLLLVITPLLFLDVIGRTGAGVAALLLAVSPMMNYYSRYYIMEIPFVLQVALFMACLWQWAKRKNKLWLLPAGLLLGWMHATKETFVLNIAALVAACAVVKLLGMRFEINERGYGFRSFTRRPKPWWSWLLFAGVAAAASMWMFSNGFHDWNHVTDSVRTYESYLGRSQGAGGHEKPWHYYLSLFFARKELLFWSEALIGGLAIVGILNAFLDARRADHKRAFLVGLSTYTLVLLLIYSVIPYKTPWSVLAVGYSFALLAGLGARTIFRAFTDVPVMKFALALALAGGIYNLCRQTSLATDYRFPGETRYASSEAHNPYAYSHTSPNLPKLSAHIHELASQHPAGKAMPVQVIQHEQGWPLPWYLRDLTHVGYQADIPEKLDAAVVIVDVDREPAVIAKLGDGWKTSYWGLRAGCTLACLEKRLPGDPVPEKPAAEESPAPAAVPSGSTSSPLANTNTSPPPANGATAANPTEATPSSATPSPPASGAMPAPALGEPVPVKAQLVEDDPPTGPTPPSLPPLVPFPPLGDNPAPVNGNPVPGPAPTPVPAPAPAPPANPSSPTKGKSKAVPVETSEPAPAPTPAEPAPAPAKGKTKSKSKAKTAPAENTAAPTTTQAPLPIPEPPPPTVPNPAPTPEPVTASPAPATPPPATENPAPTTPPAPAVQPPPPEQPASGSMPRIIIRQKSRP